MTARPGSPELTDQPNSPTSRLTEDEVRYVAKLARLSLTDDQIHRFAQQLADVLAHVAKLHELDVADVQPMAHAMDITNVMREDEPTAPMPIEAVLANAPDPFPPFFRVPKVLGDGSGP